MTGDRGFRARSEARAAITRLVRDEGAEMVARPLNRREPDGRTTQEPEPLAGIAAAVALERAVRQSCTESVRYAREDGLRWERIGAALGFAGRGAADDAYAYVCPGARHDDWFSWICPSCRKLIRDRGPEAGHPADGEQGHAEGCARFAELVRAYGQD
jgi:hypothetical protein